MNGGARAKGELANRILIARPASLDISSDERARRDMLEDRLLGLQRLTDADQRWRQLEEDTQASVAPFAIQKLIANEIEQAEKMYYNNH